PSDLSRPTYSPANTKSTAFTRTQGRSNLPLAASPPSLWRYIGRTKPNCQHHFKQKSGFLFHSQYGVF
ncbi:hypothetical protein, partial [Ochrobactrum sp. P6BS-III]|uniref:hypothetical protein n=1 Tax=Ochrobactrum sp. P6BS-III TaxID=1920636 RepID=UPI001AECC7AF